MDEQYCRVSQWAQDQIVSRASIQAESITVIQVVTYLNYQSCRWHFFTRRSGSEGSRSPSDLLRQRTPGQFRDPEQPQLHLSSCFG